MLIEQLLIFALGVLSASLLGLMIVPALSRRAMRLARRRLELQMPLSPQEILAERDQLRAQYAVAQRQTEQKFEAAQEAKAEAYGELGRRTAQLVTLQGAHELVSTALKNTASALNQTTLELVDTQAQASTLSLAHHDESQRHADMRAKHSVLQQQHGDLSNRFDDLTTRFAGITAAKAGLEIHIEDMQVQLRDMQQQIARVNAENDILNHEVQLAKHEAENSARLRERLSEALAASKSEVQSLSQNVSSAQAQLKRQTSELGDLRALNDAVQSSYDQQHLRHTKVEQEHIALSRTWQQQIENLRAEVAALEGALSASRDRAKAKSPKAHATTDMLPSPDLATLRAAITDLAAEIVRQKSKDASGAAMLERLALSAQTTSATRPRSRPSKLPKPQSLAEKILQKD